MRKIEEILRLKYEVGLSHRAIDQSCSVSSSTVSEYVTHAKAAGLIWPLPEGLSAESLDELLFPKRAPTSSVVSLPCDRHAPKSAIGIIRKR